MSPSILPMSKFRATEQHSISIINRPTSIQTSQGVVAPGADAGVDEGQRFPIDGSACSKVLSAYSGQAGKEYDTLRRDLLTVGRPSLRIAGVSAVVCPVFALDQKLAGALLLSGPESRFSDDAVAVMRVIIIEQAAALTRTLGGDPAIFAPAIAIAQGR
jgi:DNA-binding IclR family transcriptional regulator